MASANECVSSNKRARKANYSDSETNVLLEEVMLARVVLFGSFNNKISIIEKNSAWDTVTSAVNACGVTKRSRLEIKEKWKTLKSEVIGRQRRATKTGGGPPEAGGLPYEDTIMDIIGAESNLIHGVTAPSPASFVTPSVVTDDGLSQYPCATRTEDEILACTPSQADDAMSASFAMGLISQPMCSSTPLPQYPPTAPVTASIPFSLPADAYSASVVADLHDGNIIVTADPAQPDYRTRWPRRHRSRGPLSRRSHHKSTQDTTGDMEERASFIHYLKSSSDKSKAWTKLMKAQYDSELLNKTRIEAQTLLLGAQHRRELLEIARLQKEMGKSD